jgi:predicted transcriptional regulator
MRRSKLELYEDILTALAEKPLTLDAVAYRCKMDCVLLNQRLDFLMKNNLIEEKLSNAKKLYALTRRGTAIFKTLTLAKRLEKLQTATKTVNEALHSIRVFSEHDEKEAKSTQ